MRFEKTVIPALCVAAVAAFIILCAVFGKKNLTGQYGGNPTPAPTEDPCYEAIHALAAELGGEYTDGKDLSSLSYKSKADDTFATVTAYCKSGVLCMQIVRTLEPDESPQQTEDMFEGSTFSTQEPDNDSSQKLDMIAEELLLCLSHAAAPSDRDDALAKIRGALDILLAGSSKTSFVYGIRLAEFKYSKTDKLLTVVLEPAK